MACGPRAARSRASCRRWRCARSIARRVAPLRRYSRATASRGRSAAISPGCGCIRPAPGRSRRPRIQQFGSLLRRNVARSGVGALAEEMALGLLHEVLARLGIGEVEAVLVHQHGLLLEPLRPRLLGDALPDALAEIAGIRRESQTFGLAAELDALHHPSHRLIICA